MRYICIPFPLILCVKVVYFWLIAISILGVYVENPRMQYRSQISYVGKLKACVFDWSGTVVDCGVFGPTSVFMEIFENEGVPITVDEARAPMGSHKKVMQYFMFLIELLSECISCIQTNII